MSPIFWLLQFETLEKFQTEIFWYVPLLHFVNSEWHLTNSENLRFFGIRVTLRQSSRTPQQSWNKTAEEFGGSRDVENQRIPKLPFSSENEIKGYWLRSVQMNIDIF